MCTAIRTGNGCPLFGRTLDLEKSYGERVAVTPRQYAFRFLHERTINRHGALIGTASLYEGLPLYYDAVNESGLAIAGLNFPGYAHYHAVREGRYNIASYELIWWVLCQCETVAQARELLAHTNITGERVAATLPCTPLHWIISDKDTCIVAEPMEDGVRIYDNPIGVMTNAPTFPYHMVRLSDYMGVGTMPPQNRLCPGVELPHYTRGLGAMGLPGDWSSVSRFVRAAYVACQTEKGTDRMQEIERFFRMMDAVSVPAGCVRTEKGEAVRTIYTCCMDTAQGEYHYHTHDARTIRSVCLHGCKLESDKVTVCSLE